MQKPRRCERSPRHCPFGRNPATPTDTATAARPPRRCSTLAAPTWRSPSTVSHELLSSKHKSSSLAHCPPLPGRCTTHGSVSRFRKSVDSLFRPTSRLRTPVSVRRQNRCDLATTRCQTSRFSRPAHANPALGHCVRLLSLPGRGPVRGGLLALQDPSGSKRPASRRRPSLLGLAEQRCRSTPGRLGRAGNSRRLLICRADPAVSRSW
jgi:hypothetical protein